ncbi:TPA: acyltransferase family protein [Escherichia coli]
MNLKRINSISFLRVFSILSIVIYHLSRASIDAGFTPSMSHEMDILSMLGVSFFIIISGASLNVSMKKNRSTLDFFKKRIKSIYIPFWTAYIIVSILLYLSRGSISLGTDVYKLLLTFSGMDGWLGWRTQTYYLIGEWFTGFILILYLFAPLIFIGVTKNKWIMLSLSFVVSFFSYNFNDDLRNYIDILNPVSMWNPGTRLFEFVFGFIIYDYILGDKKTRISLFMISLFICIAYILSPKIIINTYVFVPFFIAMFCFISIVYESIITSDSVNKKIEYASGFSFFVFLFHHIIIYEAYDYGIINYKTDFQFYFGFISIIVLCVLLSKPAMLISSRFK